MTDVRMTAMQICRYDRCTYDSDADMYVDITTIDSDGRYSDVSFVLQQ